MAKELVTIVLHSGYSYDIKVDFEEFMEDFRGSHEQIFWPPASIFLNKEAVAMIHPAIADKVKEL